MKPIDYEMAGRAQRAREKLNIALDALSMSVTYLADSDRPRPNVQIAVDRAREAVDILQEGMGRQVRQQLEED